MRALIARWRHLIGTARRFAANSPHAAQISAIREDFANKCGQIAVSTGTWVFQGVRRSLTENDKISLDLR